MSLIMAGDIKDSTEKQWDEIFHNQILMVKTPVGKNAILPLLRECNIAFIQEVTQEEVDERMKEMEKQRKEAKGDGSVISTPQFAFPSGRGGRG